jgi:alkylation response protein AidB-like acyl-CoA dehydrogenase
VLGGAGGGLQLVEMSFAGTAALVGVFGVALMRVAFDYALNFARSEHRGGAVPIIEHQAVGYALADAKMAIEAARYRPRFSDGEPVATSGVRFMQPVFVLLDEAEEQAPPPPEPAAGQGTG